MSSRFWTKVKGLLGLGAVGAGIGAVFGTAWFTISGLLAGTVVLKAVVNAAIVYGSYGFFTASGLGLFLANARSKDSLADVSVASAGLIGAVGGAVFPVVFNILMMQSLLPLRMITAFSPIVLSLGFFGGVMTAGMVAAAKQAHRKEVARYPSTGRLRVSPGLLSNKEFPLSAEARALGEPVELFLNLGIEADGDGAGTPSAVGPAGPTLLVARVQLVSTSHGWPPMRCCSPLTRKPS